jgi:hypothetical protein
MTVLSVDAEYLLNTYFRVSEVITVIEKQNEDGSWSLLVVIKHYNNEELKYIYTYFTYTGTNETPMRDDYEQTEQVVLSNLFIVDKTYDLGLFVATIKK